LLHKPSLARNVPKENKVMPNLVLNPDAREADVPCVGSCRARRLAQR